METDFLVMMSLIAGFIVTLALFVYVYFRGLVLIDQYRENSYDAGPFFRWIIKGRHFEKHATLIILLSYIGWSFLNFLLPPIAAPMFFAFALVALVFGAFRDQRAISRFKKPPGETPRDRKILYIYLVLTAIYFAGLFSAGASVDTLLLTVAFLAYLQAPPVFIVAANFILRPFLKEARE